MMPDDATRFAIFLVMAAALFAYVVWYTYKTGVAPFHTTHFRVAWVLFVVVYVLSAPLHAVGDDGVRVTTYRGCMVHVVLAPLLLRAPFVYKIRNGAQGQAREA